MTYTLQHETPVGPVTITATGEAVTQIRFGTTVPEGSAAVPETAATPLLLKAAAQLREYFAGTRRDFSLPLAPAGTPFQQSVWQALQTIPYGETRTYGHIAMQIGHNKSFRAVGMANNRNPIVIVIPCHRVLGYDGKLTGYAGGARHQGTAARPGKAAITHPGGRPQTPIAPARKNAGHGLPRPASAYPAGSKPERGVMPS